MGIFVIFCSGGPDACCPTCIASSVETSTCTSDSRSSKKAPSIADEQMVLPPIRLGMGGPSPHRLCRRSINFVNVLVSMLIASRGTGGISASVQEHLFFRPCQLEVFACLTWSLLLSSRRLVLVLVPTVHDGKMPRFCVDTAANSCNKSYL